MPKNNNPEDNIDWSLTTWEGSRRESLRRWAKLPLEQIIAALEKMQELNDMLMTPPRASDGTIQIDTHSFLPEHSPFPNL